MPPNSVSWRPPKIWKQNYWNVNSTLDAFILVLLIYSTRSVIENAIPYTQWILKQSLQEKFPNMFGLTRQRSEDPKEGRKGQLWGSPTCSTKPCRISGSLNNSSTCTNSEDHVRLIKYHKIVATDNNLVLFWRMPCRDPETQSPYIQNMHPPFWSLCKSPRWTCK